ncbi:MAG TPA: c-type cytochrome [Alphaproteobacteria bacterium]|nr:c-type cytochrome [Alphaproteobacteria bacterium]
MTRLRTAIFLAALAAAGVVTAIRFVLSPRRSLATTPSPETHGAQAEGGLRRRMFNIAVVLAVLAVGGGLVAASGVIPIKASSGHWAITAWLLDFAKSRSVSTHTLTLDAPALDEPWLVLKGAGHYETGCLPCHGAPGRRPPRIAQAMTPPPPNLAPEVSQWQDDELFYIVKHGIKFTGMPAWPAQQRDDEVWAVVAFLRQLPNLDAEGYRRLVHGEAAADGPVTPIRALTGPDEVPRAVTASCGRCHGVDGHGRGMGAFPKLAGQRPAYLFASLQAYARGERYSGMMEPIAAGLSPEEMQALARYYSRLQEAAPSALHADATSAIERGEAIARQGIPHQRVPSCADCHGPGATRRNPFYPNLAGQYADYLVLQLESFKRNVRGGTDYAHIMRRVAAGLTLEQMRDVALYYASLPAATAPPAP